MVVDSVFSAVVKLLTFKNRKSRQYPIKKIFTEELETIAYVMH
jgi:hypothetical protein